MLIAIVQGGCGDLEGFCDGMNVNPMSYRNRWNQSNTLLWLQTYISAISNVGNRAYSVDCFWFGCTSCSGGCRTAVACGDCIANCIKSGGDDSFCPTFC